MKCGDPNNPAGPLITARGNPCGLQVVPGTNRCYMHGGASPSSLLKAQVALAALRSPAIDVAFNSLIALDRLIEQFQANECPTCGFPNSDLDTKEQLIKACIGASKSAAAILDRTGLGPRATLEVKQSDGDLNLSLFTIEERAQLEALIHQFKHLKEAVRQRLMGVTMPPPAVINVTPVPVASAVLIEDPISKDQEDK